MPQPIPLPCRLFLFDLDGTLIDSKADIACSVNLALARMSLPAVEPSRITEFVGSGVKVLIVRALQESLRRDAESDLVRRTTEHYLSAYENHLLDRTSLYPGVREALDRLSWAEMSVITNKPERFSRRILEALGIAAHFRIILGGDSTPLRKPDPGPLRLIMERCGIPPSLTVMVGDSLVDIQAGKAAGALTCGITGGFRPPEELESAGCDLIVPTVAEMVPCFCPARHTDSPRPPAGP
jgi:phosphoglycolate phosphatase